MLVSVNPILLVLGTEFGHPDFVEFPSSENNYSFLHARRHYDVGDNQELWFKYLKRFDKALNIAEEKFGWLLGSPVSCSVFECPVGLLLLRPKNGECNASMGSRRFVSGKTLHSNFPVSSILFCRNAQCLP